MKLTFEKLRYEMSTSQLLAYADLCDIKLSTRDGKYKKKIVKEIWEELGKRGFQNYEKNNI